MIPAMNQLLTNTAIRTADALIDMSTQLAGKMDIWSNIANGAGSLRDTERAGFVNKTSSDSGIDMVIDLQAPDNSNEAVLRTWAINSIRGDDGVKLFNNIQLMFASDYEKARLLTERFDTVTREDIRGLLHEPTTLLKTVVISDKSGLDEATQETYGQRYDLSFNEIIEQGMADEINVLLKTVLESLQRDADSEAR